jgi:tRNA(fMet)-specific endonuclease VapC
VLRRFETLRPGEAAVSVITFGELLYGAIKKRQKAAAREKCEELVHLLPVLSLPYGAAEAYGTIRAELETAGQVIGNNDLWIAAHAQVAELTLVTNNERKFRRVRGLKIQNWAV